MATPFTVDSMRSMDWTSLSSRFALFSRFAVQTFAVRTFAVAAFVCGLSERCFAEIEIKYFDITKGRLAFSYTLDKQTDIYVLDFDDLSISPLIKNPGVEEWPVWSPDGTKLAYYSTASGDSEIYVANYDGTDQKRLTTSPGVDEDPEWSPDGKRIVFQSGRGSKGSNLYVMGADGSAPKALTSGDKIKSVPRWSPRGNEILYSTNEFWPGWDIVLFDIPASKSKALTSGYRSYCRAAWHPSGGSFVFSYGAGDAIDIYEQDKGASQPTALITRPGRDYDAIWDDKGERLFFVSESEEGKGDFQIFVYVKATREIHQITSGAGVARYLSWTPHSSIATLEKKRRIAAKSLGGTVGDEVSGPPPMGVEPTQTGPKKP